ncbi:YheT family hydrolase [Fretibacter rubidus]|uniref:YheT family hydrolase n=1 Tax=Fretibacter rubidus TaxID=570162 RepID=UPI00352B3C79
MTALNNTPPFTPPLWMRSAMAQTILASQKFRKSGTHAMDAAAVDHVLDCGGGVRLRGAYSKHPDNKGLIILFHGWEGSQDSTYVVSHARFMFERGYSVFRLNYRDHGDSHDLNEGLFHSALFEEVWGAVMAIMPLADGAPVSIIGFSLGGNFALRVARRSITEPLGELSNIFAISPVIDPLNAAPMVDVNPLIRRYFIKKWTTSLFKKQTAFPHLYDFGDLGVIKSVGEMSERFITTHTQFASEADYFNAYRIWPDDLKGSTVPTHIIMAADDPVLPAGDVLALNLPDNTALHYLPHGGHNGFFESLRGPTWYDRFVARVLGT